MASSDYRLGIIGAIVLGISLIMQALPSLGSEYSLPMFCLLILGIVLIITQFAVSKNKEETPEIELDLTIEKLLQDLSEILTQHLILTWESIGDKTQKQVIIEDCIVTKKESETLLNELFSNTPNNLRDLLSVFIDIMLICAFWQHRSNFDFSLWCWDGNDPRWEGRAWSTAVPVTLRQRKFSTESLFGSEEIDELLQSSDNSSMYFTLSNSDEDCEELNLSDSELRSVSSPEGIKFLVFLNIHKSIDGDRQIKWIGFLRSKYDIDTILNHFSLENPEEFSDAWTWNKALGYLTEMSEWLIHKFLIRHEIR